MRAGCRDLSYSGIRLTKDIYHRPNSRLIVQRSVGGGQHLLENRIRRTGFLQKIPHTFPEHSVFEVEIEIAANADHGHRRIDFLQFLKDSAAIEPRQPPVEHHNVDILPVFLIECDRLFAVGRGKHLKATFFRR